MDIPGVGRISTDELARLRDLVANSRATATGVRVAPPRPAVDIILPRPSADPEAESSSEDGAPSRQVLCSDHGSAAASKRGKSSMEENPSWAVSVSSSFSCVT